MTGRILIVYDTKGGSTSEIIQWIKDGAASRGASVDVKAPDAVTSLNYDLIVVGTPIYDDLPMCSIKHFLESEGLRNRKVAIFVVCFAGIFGMRNFMVRKYLDYLREACDGVVVRITSFDSAMGPWRKINRAICIDFGKELASQAYSQPAAMETA
ncbi:MAG TPA: flavodoxin domain-containing protein [Methanocella sp.]|uniref:flavodoxin domain-containing protein n=1 Tax=Methanocella sp. TaxID=2052833 RepID=UPI002BD21209|nr:flavodoxin domain-containing protein [Methanocella sp.]HTY92212.1 flavodoxin domain-containing protein [Methanocella sp.]